MIRKICRYTTLGTLGLSLTLVIVALVATLAGVKWFESSVFWKVQGTIGTFFAIAIIGINVADLMDQKNVLAIVSFALMAFSALILLVLIWAPALINEGAGAEFKQKFSGSIPITSFLVTLILNPVFKLQKRMHGMQVVTWILLGLVYIQFMALVWVGKGLSDIIFVASGIFNLWIPCVAIIGLEITAAVLGKKAPAQEGAQPKAATGKILVSKEEYEALKAKVAELEEKLKSYEG